jgi:hypothetical protein
MALDPVMSAALEAQGLHAAIAIKIALEDGPIRLFDGSGNIRLFDEVYAGQDSLFGTLDTLDTIQEAVAEEAPTVSIGLQVSSTVGMAKLLLPQNQGALVSIYFSVIDYATATAIGQPELLWKGRIDTGKIKTSANRQDVEIMTTSAFDRLFTVEEGARLNPVWHKKIWPNETGLDFNVAGLADPMWGAEGATGGGSYGGGSYGGGVRNSYVREVMR